MGEQAPPPQARGEEKEHSPSRLEHFSDKVFAFCVTLLIIFEVPRTYEQMVDTLSAFIPFGLGFAAVMLIWFEHNRFFSRYTPKDSWIAIINSVLLFILIFYIYPLHLLARFAAHHVVPGWEASHNEELLRGVEVARLYIIYGLGLLGVMWCFSLFYWRALALREKLGLSEPEAIDTKWTARLYLGLGGIALLSILLALGGIGIGIGLYGWVYFTWPLLIYAVTRLERRERKEFEQRSAQGSGRPPDEAKR